MSKASKSRIKNLLAVSWLWTRNDSADLASPVDLETLDQWRQGKLVGSRAAEVKRQLARDPRLMRMLEELIAAEEYLNEFERKGIENARPSVLKKLKDWITNLLEPLRNPAWSGGLAATAAALILVVILLPQNLGPDLGRELNDIYASIDEPADGLQVPWTPKLAVRGGQASQESQETADFEKILELSFQSGMVDAFNKLETRFPEIDLNPGGYIKSSTVSCSGAVPCCPCSA